MNRILAALVLFGISFPMPAAERRPLLPRPRQIRYGSGHFRIHDLNIRLSQEPTAEDWFAANTLSACLSDRARIRVPVSENGGADRIIALKRTGAVGALAIPGEQPGPESREAYWINSTPHRIDLLALSTAGLFYGVQTLCQLAEGSGAEAQLPEVEIHDWPSLAYRGVMIDTSHGPLPTESEVKRQLDFLARWKNNQYYLYSEASVALEGYPILSPEAQFSQDEIRRIVAYARERHIDVVPCVELYGHLHDLFRAERYADLAILPHGSEFDPRNPEVGPLLVRWVDQLSGLFPSRFFHIGFDETREAPVVAVGKVSAATLYLEQFRLVSDLVRRQGKTALVWSDMFSRYPNLIQDIPAGTIVVPWGYDRTVYEPYWKPFADSPLPRFVATGVSIWDQVAPNFDRSFDNIDTFLSTGRQHGASGLINTVWTDDISVLIRPAFPGIAYGAAAAWQTGPINRAEFFPEYAQIMYSESAAPEVASGLADLSRSEVELALAVNGGRPDEEETSPSFWDDPLTPAHVERAEKELGHFHQTRILAEEGQAHLRRALELGGEPSMLSDLLLEARLLDYAGMKNIYAAELAGFWRGLGSHPEPDRVSFYLNEASSHDHSRIEDLMDYSGDLQQAYRAAWLDSYTTYRLGTVMGKWNGEFEYWWKLQRRFHDFRAAFHRGETLPAISSFSPGY